MDRLMESSLRNPRPSDNPRGLQERHPVLHGDRTPPPAPNHLDWSLVRSFLAVLNAGSLMGAARQLQAQQPTLSRHVAELETQLGAALFERTGRGVVLTATALAIADAARQMQDGADALQRTLAVRRQASTG